MVQLNWKTALVTGSSRGIGRGIAHKLVDAGIKRIAVNYVDNDTAANETAEKLRGKGAEVLLIKGTSKNDATDVKLCGSRGSRGSRAGLASGFSVFSGSPAGLFPSQCGLQADSFPDDHHVGAAATRRFSCTRRRML